MKKQAVVLLITLFFISSISLLILKNLDDSNSFIDEISLGDKLTQIKLTHKNIQDEVIDLTSKHSENIDDILEVTSIGVPFNYADIELTITLQEYIPSGCYFNNIKKTETLYDMCDDSEIVDSILYQYDFRELLDKYQPFDSQEQIDYFLEQYRNLTRDENIDKIKDHIIYVKPLDENSTSDGDRYLQCTYDAVIKESSVKGNFIYKLNGSKIISNNISIY